MIKCPKCAAQNRPTARFCLQCGNSLVAQPGTMHPGRIMHNRYRILRPLSKGGMGAIYLVADQDAFDKNRVIKEMLDYVDPADHPTPADYQNAVQKARQRFEEEGRTLAALKHRGIPEIIAYFAENNSNYIVMEYVEGHDLEQELTHENSQGQPVPGRAYPTEQVIGYGIQVCKVLEYLSTFNPPVIHQDIKPANLISDKSGEVRLVDFGTARAKMVPQPGGRVGLQKSSIYGTVGYAPPEQYQAKSEPRSDVYALAATLYHLLTDDDPRSHPFSFPQLTSLPQPVWDVLAEALEQDVQRRPSAGQLRAELEALLAPKTGQTSIHLRGGGIARTVSELAQVCHQHWEDGKYHLYRGDFEPLLRGWGRNDLEAKAATICQNTANQDMGLDAFMRQLNPHYAPPSLQLLTGRLDGGAIAWTNKGQLSLQLQNGGCGCLSGRITALPPWLEAKTADFTTPNRVTIPLTIDTNKLSPQKQPYSGFVVLEAGAGGQAQLPVTVLVPEPQPTGLPADINLGTAYQGESLDRQIVLTNQGQSRCKVEISSPAGWLTMRPTTFQLEPGKTETVHLTANTAKMGLGNHAADLRLKATAGQWKQNVSGRVALTLPWRKTFWHRYKAPTTVVAIFCLLVVAFFVAFFYWQWTLRNHYQAGLAYLSDQRWEDAIAEFEAAGSYRDAETQILETYYQAGLIYQEAQQWEEAIAEFEAAGSYEDAETQIRITGILRAGGNYQISAIDGMVQVGVPAGRFLMGSVNTDTTANDDEKPRRFIHLDGYWIDQTEVTNAMYALCVAAGSCSPPTNQEHYNDPDYANHPVVYVDWEQANSYCAWAGRALPTEAQWEKAARGPDGQIYPWGNEDPSCDLANYGDCFVRRTTEVGAYIRGSSPYQALDMAGNVWEWVTDWYDADYYDISPEDNPTGPATGAYKVLRGGAWVNDNDNIRAVNRYSLDPVYPNVNVGFRCVQE